MNMTKAQARAALGFRFDTELADFFGISKQALSQRKDDEPIPDAWCWRGHKSRPDVFTAANKSEAEAA